MHLQLLSLLQQGGPGVGLGATRNHHESCIDDFNASQVGAVRRPQPLCEHSRTSCGLLVAYLQVSFGLRVPLKIEIPSLPLPASLLQLEVPLIAVPRPAPLPP